MLDFLDTWVVGGLGLGGLGLGVGLGLPQAPQSPCDFVSVGHVWTPIGSSACAVCSFLFFFTSINIFRFQHRRSCRWRYRPDYNFRWLAVWLPCARGCQLVCT
jgi:hypothetical protein